MLPVLVERQRLVDLHPRSPGSWPGARRGNLVRRRSGGASARSSPSGIRPPVSNAFALNGPASAFLADEEIRTLWITLDELAASDADPVLADGKKVPRLVVASAVKLLLLLGTRRSETFNMRWADVDEHAKAWTVPGMFRKGGRTHVVPLPPLALDVLKDLRPVTGKAPWVFVGKRGASLANNPGRFADFIRETAALDFKLHDLRRTCATGCARLGASESTVSRILGHKAIAGTIAVSGIYDRFDRLPEIRTALTAWSDYVEALIRE